MVQVNLTMGFALHYGLFCALLASLIRSSVFTHSLISLLAKRKTAAYCCAKSSSTMPGIFFCLCGAISLCRSAPCGVRSSSHVRKYIPVGSHLQNPPGCAISLLMRLAGAAPICRAERPTGGSIGWLLPTNVKRRIASAVKHCCAM